MKKKTEEYDPQAEFVQALDALEDLVARKFEED